MEHSSFPVTPGLDSVQTLSISSLQWVLGAFIATLGALILVSPHQFGAAAYGPIRPLLAWFGPGFLLGGGWLLVIATLRPSFHYVVLAHLFAGSMLVILAGGFAFSANWSGTSNYGVLGLGTALAPFVARLRTSRTSGEAFSLLIGLATAFTGLLFLTMPAQFNAAVYDLVRAYLPWVGLAFVVSGVIVCLSQLGNLVPSGLGRWSHLLVAGCYFVFGSAVALPGHAWTGIAYYGGLGGALVVLAWMGPRLRQLDPKSLRTRLALVLAAAAAVPVLVLTPVYSHEEETQAVSAQFANQQGLASALAQNVADYVTLHEAALKSLATQPGLLAMSPAEQQLLLQRSKEAYPDIDTIRILAADGEPIAGSDDPPVTAWLGGALVVEAPIFDAQGRFGGMVSASLESSRVAGLLNRIQSGADTQTYLVDASGRVVAHQNVDLVARTANQSSSPSFVVLPTDQLASGSQRVVGPGGEVLASFARVRDLDWSVIVERSSASALAPIRSKLDLLFGGLVLLIGAASAFGAVAAGWMNRALVTLGKAVVGLAGGDDTAPLPTGGLTEVAGLAVAFGIMRARVIDHAAELLAANRELEALYRVGQTITAPLHLQVVLNTIARSTAELLASDSGAILLVDEATQTLTVEGAFGLSERAVRETRDRIGESIAGRVVQTGLPIIANDLPNNPLFFNPAAAQEQLLSLASVPLVVGERIIGTLDVHSRTDRFAFDAHDISVLQLLGSQAAIALENARLYQEVEAARDDLETRVQERTAELIAANERLQQEIGVRMQAEAAQRQAETQILALNGDLERRVVQRTAALEAANKELEAFSYSVSHDLRAPLRAINGFSRIILEEHAAQLEPEAQSYFQLVRDNASQMGSLIDDLLRFSRLSRQGLRKDRVLPAEIVQHVLADLASEHADRRVEVVVGVLLPCRADPALLKQLFVNLLGNAFKFTRQRPIGHVEVGCREADGEVVYFVKDDGAGFDMRYVDKLFGVFQRLHRAEDYEGTGVGLAIVQRVVQRHGGRVWADGALDHGATFSFTLAGAQADGADRSLETQLDDPDDRDEEGSDDNDGFARRSAA
jgi:signal transduction histidine kinase